MFVYVSAAFAVLVSSRHNCAYLEWFNTILHGLSFSYSTSHQSANGFHKSVLVAVHIASIEVYDLDRRIAQKLSKLICRKAELTIYTESRPDYRLCMSFPRRIEHRLRIELAIFRKVHERRK